MEKDARIYIAGHQGMVGSAIQRRLKLEGYKNIMQHTSYELDLRNQQAVEYYFENETPEYVFLAATRSGGIHAHESHPAEFIYDNLMIEANIIHQCFRSDVKKLIFIAPSFVYPVDVHQPVREESLLNGKLQKSYESYAVAKIAGIKMCQAYNRQYDCHFASIISTDLYGPATIQDELSSNVIPALIHRMHNAKIQGKDSVEVWGTGTVRKNFLHVDDLASACLIVMDWDDSPEIINVAGQESTSIQEVAELIKESIGYQGHIYFNPAKPDTRVPINLASDKIQGRGWKQITPLRAGIVDMCNRYQEANKVVA